MTYRPILPKKDVSLARKKGKKNLLVVIRKEETGKTREVESQIFSFGLN